MGGVESLVVQCLFDLEGPGDIALGVGDGGGGGHACLICRFIS